MRTEQPEDGAAGSGHGACLRLLATADLHGRLLSFDYATDRARPGTSLAALAPVLARLRRTARASLLLDAGDLLQGTALTDEAARPALPGPHPMIAAMNALGYDAATLGNHDFDHGLPALARALAGARFPVVVSNLCGDVAGTLPGLRRSAILHRMLDAGAGDPAPLAVGVLGLLPPQTQGWNRDLLGAAITLTDIAAAATAAAAALRRAGADIVVAICHSGPGGAGAGSGAENAARAVAAGAGVDAVIAAHTHAVLAVDAPVPIVQPGAFASHVGVIDLRLGRVSGRWRAVSATASAVPVPARAGACGAPRLARLAAPVHRAARRRSRRRLGQGAVALTTHFALLGPSAALDLLAEAQMAALPRLADTGGAPVLAAVSPFRAGGAAGPLAYADIPPGPITEGLLKALYPFPNRLAAWRITGAGLRAWLDHAARIYATLAPGGPPRPLLRADVPAYEFDVVGGLEYRIDLGRPTGRITDLRHRGRPVADEAQFILVSNSYRAGGGGGYPLPPEGARLCLPGVPVRGILADHIAARSPLRPARVTRWRLTAPAGARAIFETGAAAAAHAPGPGAPAIRPITGAPPGWLRYEIRF